MPQLTFNLGIEDIAKIIMNLDDGELESLSILLSNNGEELLKRKNEILNNEVKTLSRDEVFEV